MGYPGGMPDNYVAGGGNPFSGAISSGNLGWEDAFVPGINFLMNKFDVTGKNAAQQQYDAQMALNHQSQEFNALEAQKARDFQQYMRNTNYQAMVNDLKAAGLNPWLALGNLGGSGTPSGSSAASTPGSADMANNKLTAAAGVLAIFLRMILKGK